VIKHQESSEAQNLLPLCEDSLTGLSLSFSTWDKGTVLLIKLQSHIPDTHALLAQNIALTTSRKFRNCSTLIYVKDVYKVQGQETYYELNMVAMFLSVFSSFFSYPALISKPHTQLSLMQTMTDLLNLAYSLWEPPQNNFPPSAILMAICQLANQRCSYQRQLLIHPRPAS
jgi:hypothetical protein